jgi:ADP-ribosylglycohydrolase
MLQEVHAGAPWRDVARSAFAGMGSMGNGAAMRVAPLGAWFAGDLDLVVEQAARSAEVTHANVNAVAGAVAVAVAAACFVTGDDPWGAVLDRTPVSLTREMLHRAASLPSGSSVQHAAAALGSGDQVCAHDTVPFALWCAVRHRGSFEDCLWTTVSGGGDRDTTCAIAGGVVAADPAVRVPDAWSRRVEALR